MSEVTALSSTDLTDNELKYTFEQNEGIQRLRRSRRSPHPKLLSRWLTYCHEKAAIVHAYATLHSFRNIASNKENGRVL
ncbi:MAG: hypothetical protein ACE5PV_20450 [Candidatus Poribacteria bacterium]